MRHLHPLGVLMVVVTTIAGLYFGYAFQGQPFAVIPIVPWWVWGFAGLIIGLVVAYGLGLGYKS